MIAIETRYQGYRFRSRLEARWAVFLDALNIKWEYEKEGFKKGHVMYLPDFWLPNVYLRGGKPGVWLEIKPTLEYIEAEKSKFEIIDQPLVVFHGIPEFGYSENGYQYQPWWDNPMLWVKCYDRACGVVKIEFSEGNYMNCPVCGGKADDEHPDFYKAVIAAKSARFERTEAQP